MLAEEEQIKWLSMAWLYQYVLLQLFFCLILMLDFGD